MENRAMSSRGEKFTLPNVFPARDRKFIVKLSDDLHLNVAWDEYDDQDQNLVTWRFPGALANDDDEPGDDQAVEDEGGDENEWEDTEDDEEAMAAVDRVLEKYEKATVMDPDAEGSFDERHDRRVKKKMDDWKRDYYRVSSIQCRILGKVIIAFSTDRTNWRYHTTIPRQWVI
jgi:5'-3' exoribonuclease 1